MIAMNLRLFYFKNMFDNVVTDEASITYTWEELVEQFSEFKVTDTKENCELFIAANFNTDPVTCRPATRKSYDKAGNLLSETLILDEAGNIRCGRMADNVTAVSALVLDYDGGVTLETVIPTLEGITHLGYTSFSHMKDGKTHKFRVIVPFSEPCPKEEWDLRKDDALTLFPGVDASTINIARAFYIPSCPPHLKDQTFAWNMDGEFFDWRILNRKPELPAPIPVDRSKLTRDGNGRPVWETFDIVQFMKDEGLYIKAAGGNKHNVCCPNYMAHTNHAKGGTVVWQDSQGFPSFYCSHGHCADFNFWSFFKEKYGKGWMAPYCERLPSAASIGLKFIPKQEVSRA